MQRQIGSLKLRRERAVSNGVRTLGEAAFVELRRRLIDGTLPPGEPLRLERLKVEFGVGFTPLREALMRLSSDGLVQVQGLRGFRAAAISLEDLDDVMLTRGRIEALALEDAIARGDEDWEAAIVGAFHRMSRRNAIDPLSGLVAEDWAEAHQTFHFSLIAACKSRWIKRFWQTLFDQARRYRQLAVLKGSPYRDDLAEHRHLMEAVLARDLTAARAASREHIESTTMVVRRLLSELRQG
jgi:GntR family carbon starvation induced transcriptional regulator